MLKTYPVLTGVCLLAISAHAAPFKAQNVIVSESTLVRHLDSMGFQGSSAVMTSNHIGRINNSVLYGPDGAFGWSDNIARDMDANANKYEINPDCADVSEPYLNEAFAQGTLQEVFGQKNLNHLMDSEGSRRWSMDMFFDGFSLAYDNDRSSVELALFERGMNSDIFVRGIYRDGDALGYTSGILITRDMYGDANFALDTLEIGNAQEIGAVGLDILDLGIAPSNLIGVELIAEPGYNGPDIVNIGVVPEPASVAGILLGAVALLIRRKR